MDEILLGTTWKPWLKPLFVGIYRRNPQKPMGFLGVAEDFAAIHSINVTF